MRIFGRVLMNAADKGGPGAGVPGTADPMAQLAEVLAGLKTALAELPKNMEAAANKAVHGAFAKQRKDAVPPPAAPPPKDDDDDDDDDLAAAAAGGQPGAAAPVAGIGDQKLARKLKALEKRDKEREAERAAEKAEAAAKALEAQHKEDRAALAELLTGKVRSEMVKSAVALHFDSKRVGRDEDDPERRVWRDGDDVLSLEDGVARWLSTPEGKAHTPPVDAKGSGNKGGGAVGADGKRAYSDADIGQLVTVGIPGFNR